MRMAVTAAPILLVSICLTGCGPRESATPTTDGDAGELFIYCAGGLSPAIDRIVEQFKVDHPSVKITTTYGNTGKMYAQIKLKETGDLYVAGDEIRMKQAADAGHVVEYEVMAYFKPVLATPPDNPKNVQSLADLKREGVNAAFGRNEAAIGKMSDEILRRLGGYDQVLAAASRHGTVGQLCQALRIGTQVDAAIVWDATAAQHGLSIVPTRELADEKMPVPIGLLKYSKNPELARKFITACLADSGQEVFERLKYNSRRKENPQISRMD